MAAAARDRDRWWGKGGRGVRAPLCSPARAARRVCLCSRSNGERDESLQRRIGRGGWKERGSLIWTTHRHGGKRGEISFTRARRGRAQSRGWTVDRGKTVLYHQQQQQAQDRKERNKGKTGTANPARSLAFGFTAFGFLFAFVPSFETQPTPSTQKRPDQEKKQPQAERAPPSSTTPTPRERGHRKCAPRAHPTTIATSSNTPNPSTHSPPQPWPY